MNEILKYNTVKVREKSLSIIKMQNKIWKQNKK